MRAGSILAILCAGGALLLPLRAYGHGGQFFLAKLSEPDAGSNRLGFPGTCKVLRLEVTADYGANPMLNGEADAASALTHILLLRNEGVLSELEQVAVRRFEKRTKSDTSSPLVAGPDEGEAHQLLTVIWEWPRTSDAIAFEIPKGNPQNVIFWRIDPQTQQPQPPWSALIAGDSTPVIALAVCGAYHRMLCLGAGIAGLLIVLGLIVWAKVTQRRRERTAPVGG